MRSSSERSFCCATATARPVSGARKVFKLAEPLPERSRPAARALARFNCRRELVSFSRALMARSTSADSLLAPMTVSNSRRKASTAEEVDELRVSWLNNVPATVRNELKTAARVQMLAAS